MLETKDLRLGKARFEDWQAMYRHVWSRRSSFRFMVLEPSPDEAEARERMRRTIAFQQERETAYTIFLKSTGEAIGFAGLEELEPGVWGETGICLGQDFWGRGYGTQVLDCLLALARERGAKVFCYASWEENAASRALAAKAGFEPCGTEEHTRPHDGRAYRLIRYQKRL